MVDQVLITLLIILVCVLIVIGISYHPVLLIIAGVSSLIGSVIGYTIGKYRDLE